MEKHAEVVAKLAKLVLELSRNSDQKLMLETLALLDSGSFLRDMIETQYLQEQVLAHITSDQSSKIQYLKTLAVVLQATRKCRFKILRFISDHKKELNPFELINDETHGEEAMRTIFRFFEAEPFMRRFWDPAPLFAMKPPSSKLGCLVHDYTKRMLYDAGSQVSMPASDSLVLNLELDLALRVNRSMHEFKAREYEQRLGSLDAVADDDQSSTKRAKTEESNDRGELVITDYLRQKKADAVESIESDVFRHLAVVGEEGSGKMSYVRLLCHHYDHQEFIVVTLEETFDSKNLVGTYVCNEIGEFVFKKGPLTVAAEQGMWLILRNIDKSPPDLLSFLLPLVQENKLQVTSTFSIVPKLGFRMVALSSAVAALKDTCSISPFLSLLHQVHLDRLQSRSDYLEIISSKYRQVHPPPWSRDLLLHVPVSIEAKLNAFKGALLVLTRFSVKSIFKTFSRINESLKPILHTDDPTSTYLSSETLRGILQDISEVYLAHIYDKRIRAAMMTYLVSECFNPVCGEHDLCQLDPAEFVDYMTTNLREHAINSSQFFFGRSKPVLRNLDPTQQETDASDTTFVFQSSTLRLMEQICQSLQMNESLLLVGETGTGKTSSVQELARLQGKQLHVFNMNQNTDSSDLLGGFKPVDIKFLLRPVYELFLTLFRTAFKSGKNQEYLDLVQKCYEGNQVREFI